MLSTIVFYGILAVHLRGLHAHTLNIHKLPDKPDYPKHHKLPSLNAQTLDCLCTLHIRRNYNPS